MGSWACPGDIQAEVLGAAGYLGWCSEVRTGGQRDRMGDRWVSGRCCYGHGAWKQLLRVPRRWDPTWEMQLAPTPPQPAPHSGAHSCSVGDRRGLGGKRGWRQHGPTPGRTGGGQRRGREAWTPLPLSVCTAAQAEQSHWPALHPSTSRRGQLAVRVRYGTW